MPRGSCTCFPYNLNLNSIPYKPLPKGYGEVWGPGQGFASGSHEVDLIDPCSLHVGVRVKGLG